MSVTIGEHLWKIFDVEITKTVLNDCISASRALAELKGMVKSLNTMSLTCNYIALSESRAAFTLAGHAYSKEQVFRSAVAKEGNDDPELKRLIDFAEVMKKHSENPPTEKTISAALSETCNGEASLRRYDLDERPLDANRAIFFASGTYVSALLDQLCEYVKNDNGTDELIRTAIAMLLFDIIRPYGKDNELASTLFINTALNFHGLSDGCELLFTTTLAEHREEYYDAVYQAESTGHTEGWIRFLLRTIRESALLTMSRINTMQAAYEEAYENCKELSFFSKDLLDTVFSNIYCKSQMIIRAGLAERVTAMKYLKTLEEMGYLESEKVGRETIFKNILLDRALMK